MQSQDVRKLFLNHFKQLNHTVVPSSSLVPQDDPTLLFNNAGMNQFKDIFLGHKTPPSNRAVSIQKCVRAGGKHNDLDNVGMTARHHTFFEMLGNFSFGDYFKKEAIEFAWSLLTDVYKIPESKLFVTVYHQDDEALKLWHKHIGLPLNKIFKKDSDNFWQMGEFGPCGPSTEIFFDHGPQYIDPNLKGKKLGDILEDEMRYVEIWNLVFMQFNKNEKGTFDLPRPSIDTGSGLERLTAALQGVYWNYETDLFSPLIKSLETASKLSYRALAEKEDPHLVTCMRVVSDHIRAASMLITDGVIPSNEGRGHVLRRIIRRAVRHLRELPIDKEFKFHHLTKDVFSVLGNQYPENMANMAMAEKFIKIEEEKFLETLEKGMSYLKGTIVDLKQKKQSILPAKDVFFLYDTYGVPTDLTALILREEKLTLDEEGYQKLVEEQKEESKKSWKGKEDLEKNKELYELYDEFGATEFTGYHELERKEKLLAEIKVADKTFLLFKKTPFYAEGGGQVGEVGFIYDEKENLVADVINTLSLITGFTLHEIKKKSSLEKNKSYHLKVNREKRLSSARNHSATHLLHSALGEVLGPHVKQAGSLVSPHRLRFDFTHFAPLSREEIKNIEEKVNGAISLAYNTAAALMTKEEALAQGAKALFDEKYGDKVRVVSMGDVSTELCGGVHVSNTQEIGLFTIISEQGLSSGIRRIEAKTSKEAFDYLSKRSSSLKELETHFSKKENELTQHLIKLEEDLKKLERSQAEASKNQKNKEALEKIQSSTHNDEIITYLFLKDEEMDLKTTGDLFMQQKKELEAMLFLVVKKEKGISFLLRLSPLLSKRCDLKKIFTKEIKDLLGAKGGGRSDMMSGQLENLTSIQEALKLLKSALL